MNYFSRAFVVLVLLAGAAEAGEVCLAPAEGQSEVALVACGPSELQDCGYFGYNTDGTPCQDEPGCGVLPWPPLPFYGWSLSSSSKNSFANSGPLEGVATLYLWLHCAGQEGVAASEFVVEVLGEDLIFLASVTRNGFLNAGSGTHFQLAAGGCPRGPVVAAELLFLVVPPVSVESETWSDVKAMYR